MHDFYDNAEGLRSSELGYLLKSPAHYKAHKAKPQEPTPAMVLGTYIHSAVLEPGKVEFKVAPKCDRRTTEGKAIYAKFLDNCKETDLVVSESDFDIINGIKHSVRQHSMASHLLSGGDAELPIFWEDSAGVKCKARLDYYNPIENCVVDIKTTESATFEDFSRSIYKYAYHRQAAWYLDAISQKLGKEVRDFVIVAVEKIAPFAIQCYKLDGDAIFYGREKANRAKEIFAECEATGNWPCFEENIKPIGLPVWGV